MKKYRSYAVIAVMMLVMFAGCTSQNEETYQVDITAADFVPAIDNPYLPFIPDSKWVYEARLEDATTDRDEVEVVRGAAIAGRTDDVVAPCARRDPDVRRRRAARKRAGRQGGDQQTRHAENRCKTGPYFTGKPRTGAQNQ